MFAPILTILALVNIGQRNRENGEPQGGATVIAYIMLIAMYGCGLFIGLILQAASVIVSTQPGLGPELVGDMGGPMFDNLSLLAVGLWAPSSIGLVLLLKPVRRLLSRLLPIDVDSPIDTAALSLSMLVLINLIVTLGIGLGNMASLMEEQTQNGDTVGMVSLWVQEIFMAITAAIGVGWLTRKKWTPMLLRLGIVRPSMRQVAIGVLAGLAMVPVVALLGWASEAMGIQPDQDVAKLTEELLGGLMKSPWGILTLGLAAALGEEPLFRGAAQPKFGIILTALLFALVHSNYGITISTVIVFVLGIILGIIRIRHNTSTSMITHAVYNISLGLIAYFSLPFFDS